MKLPGEDVHATLWRTPHAGGAWINVLPLVLKRFLGVLFQPEAATVFMETQGGAIFKRHMVIAEWPHSVDPTPVHPQDQIRIPFTHPASAIIAANPAPTVTTATITQHPAMAFVPGQPVTVNGVATQLGVVSGQTFYFARPLAAAPPAGSTITQDHLEYAVDDAYSYEGHHIEIYVRIAPYNA